MFDWIFGNKTKKLEEETKKSFSSVKDDMDKIGKWIKHLDEGDKQLFEMVYSLKHDLSTIKDNLEEVKESINLAVEQQAHKQVFKKLPVVGKQTAVEAVQELVQTPVQTGNFYEILKNLTGNERLIIFTLLNSENGMKLSYEDLALILGKERATIRGQVNAIKQKSEGLIEEITEKNGKKRVFIPEEVREKLLKYAKVRVRGGKKS
jgi:regulator of replication initiation timing